ncbi:hypothetical protein BKG93_06130 [Rodentibacter ratti]|uniref:Uncharacterized protein n=2 Tax=Rodentibacter TaxID=1960084 RepID=A0A1V3L4F7_9PAST|nr:MULTISPECIES: hypothetical protein [Rodentibacter]OOF79644.1 hypothetical protein BKG96_01195 [Rodentibacter heylii]OOF84827.1 hypothetical protein BKG93_06130 [Rodentibacter ratti]QIA76811.1 hypothetical protein FEE42_05295 [Rodentibacter heylii]
MKLPYSQRLRYLYIRWRLKKFLLKKQESQLEVFLKHISSNRCYIDIDLFESFRSQYKLSLGEMGILLREILWNPYKFFSLESDLVLDWLYPSLDYYSDYEILKVVFKPTLLSQIDNSLKNEKRDELELVQDFYRSLVEYIIRKRLYLYSNIENRVGVAK